MDGKIPVARPIEDVVADCRKIFISRLPGNKFVYAGWSAFCEAWREYEFAKGIITTQEIANRHSDTYLWLHHGKYQAYAGVIRKIADGLGVENVCGGRPAMPRPYRGLSRGTELVPATKISLGDRVWWMETYWLAGYPSTYRNMGLVETKRKTTCVVRDRYGHTWEVEMGRLLKPET